MLNLADWRYFALASAFFAALTAVLGKVGVAGINSNFATFLRTTVILVVTAAIVSFRKEWQPWDSLNNRAVLFLVLSGLATGASWLCYYRALQLGPVSKVAVVDKFSLVMAILLAVLFLGEQLTWKIVWGGLLVTAGTLVMVL